MIDPWFSYAYAFRSGSQSLLDLNSCIKLQWGSHFMAIKIHGIEGMNQGELEFELQRGGKFVLFQYCVSVIVLTFRRPSAIYLIRGGESALAKGLPFTLLSLVAGWWAIPWGPVYTIPSVYSNSCGGKDVTQAILNSLLQPAQASSAPSLRPPHN
jgi:hypothetical protein